MEIDWIVAAFNHHSRHAKQVGDTLSVLVASDARDFRNRIPKATIRLQIAGDQPEMPAGRRLSLQGLPGWAEVPRDSAAWSPIGMTYAEYRIAEIMWPKAENAENVRCDCRRHRVLFVCR